MRPNLPSPLNRFSYQLTLISCLAVPLLLTGARAAAQGAAAGPMPQAAPSDRPVDQPAAKPRALTIGGKPNLAGTWVLNKDESDDARQKIEEARGSSGQNSGQQPRWGGGTGVGAGGGGWGTHGSGYPGGGGGGGRRGQSGNGAAESMDELSRLTIDQTESTLKVTGDSGRELATYPAPSQSQSSSSNSGSSSDAANTPPPPTVEWKDNQLVVTEKQGRRGTTTRTYELSPDGKQLDVTTTLDNPRFKNPVTIRFVYDPASSGG